MRISQLHKVIALAPKESKLVAARGLHQVRRQIGSAAVSNWGQTVGTLGAGDFASVLGRALQQVNEMQIEADKQARDIATGRCENIHEAILAIEKAQLALQLTVATINRAVEAYKEIHRLQI